MLNEDAIKQLFAENIPLGGYLDFETNLEVSQSLSIRNREVATEKSFDATSLNETAQLQGSASYQVIYSLIKTIYKTNLMPEIKGVVVELGSGIGLLGITFISLDKGGDIFGVLAVEAGLPFVKKGIRMAASELLGENSNKIFPCYGTFDKLDIGDNTVDVVIQIEALHHAEELSSAINESFRILKRGGYLVSIDRSWPDSTKRSVLEDLLNHEYPKSWLEVKGFPSNEKFTRRDNGEHEYIDSDWLEVFTNSGFEMKSFKILHPKITLWHIVKRITCLLKLEKILGIRISSRKGILRGFLLSASPYLASKLGGVITTEHPRSLTLQIYKKI